MGLLNRYGQRHRTGSASPAMLPGIEKVEWDDGSRYEGQLLDNEPHGQGTLHYKDGMIYDGHFQYGVPSGRGRMTTADGDIFDGEWKDGEYVGKWEEPILPNPQPDETEIQQPQQTSVPTVYEPTMIASEANEEVVTDSECDDEAGDPMAPACSEVYDGETDSQGRPHGNGRLRHSDGSVQVGSWVHGVQNGEGELRLLSGAVFKGVWVKGELPAGEFLSPSGDVLYNGELEALQANGSGWCRLLNGAQYQGSFRMGELHGPGVLQNPDGSTQLEGVWDEGVWDVRHPGKARTPTGSTDSVAPLTASPSSTAEER